MDKIILNFKGNLGHEENQVKGITLKELFEMVENAMEYCDVNTEVLLFECNNGNGANYGEIINLDW